MSEIKSKTISAMIWSSIGRFGTTVIQFISNLVLAHQLMPADFGCIGMLQIFIAVSEVFVAGGFGQALIQKKHPTHIDYTTVFYWNIFASIILYILLFITAPVIALFYKMPLLCKVLRVQSLIIIIHAFIVVQNNQLQKQLRFKELSIRGLIATSIGTTTAIIIAYMGGGVWSLVSSSIISSIVSVFLLWNMSSWRPTLEFSWSSFRELFSFGGLMAISSIFERVYSNIQGFIIGRLYTASDMGYYSQAKRLEEVPTQALSQIVSQVSFPVFSALQDNKDKLKIGVQKNIKSLTYLNFPMSMLMWVVASPLINLLYGPKWEVSIPYFRILCFASLIYTTNIMNMSVIKALGRGRLYLVSQIIKRSVGLILIIFGAFIGIKGILWAVVFSTYFSFFFNTTINKYLIDYGIITQIRDILGNLSIATISAILTFFISRILLANPNVILIIQVLFYILFYFVLSSLFKIEAFIIYKNIISAKFKGLKFNN